MGILQLCSFWLHALFYATHPVRDVFNETPPPYKSYTNLYRHTNYQHPTKLIHSIFCFSNHTDTNQFNATSMIFSNLVLFETVDCQLVLRDKLLDRRTD